MFTRMSETDAFSGERNGNVKMFGRNYGSHNFKLYHYVYGNGNVKTLKKGEKDSYHGLFCFTPSVSDKLLPCNENLRLSDIKYDSDIAAIKMQATINNNYFHDIMYVEDLSHDELTYLPISDLATYIAAEKPEEITYHLTNIDSGQHNIRIGYMVNDKFIPLTEIISFTSSEPITISESGFYINIVGVCTIFTKHQTDASHIKIINLSGQEQLFSASNDCGGLEIKLLNTRDKILLIYSTDGVFKTIKGVYNNY